MLILGPRGIGKSRSAAHNIKKVFGGWFTLRPYWVVSPKRGALDDPSSIWIPKIRCIVLLDDLNEYLQLSESGGVFQFIRRIQELSKETVIVGTIRSSAVELSRLTEDPHLIAMWDQYRLKRWSDESGSGFAKLENSNMRFWDGTPLSVIAPPEEIALLYDQMDSNRKNVLKAMKTLLGVGFTYFPLEILEETTHYLFSVAPEVTRDTVNDFHERQLLLVEDEHTQPFQGFAEQVYDWRPSREEYVKLRKVLKDSRYVTMLGMLADYYYRQEWLEDAREAYEVAVRKAPKRADLRYKFGKVIWRLSKTSAEASIFHIKRAIELSPRWLTPRYKLVDILREAGREDESFQEFSLAQRISSPNPELRLLSAEAFRVDGSYDAAILEYDYAIENLDDPASALYGKARALKDTEQFEEAIHYYKDALRAKPNWAEAHFGLAGCYVATNNEPKGIVHYRKAMRFEDNIPQVYMGLSRVLKSPLDEEQVLRNGLEKYPDNPILNSYLAENLFKQAKQIHLDDEEKANTLLQESRSLFELALELRDEEYPEALAGLATVARLLDDIPAAIRANSRLTRLDPEDPNGYFGLGMCLYNEKEYEHAEEQFKKVIKIECRLKGAAYYYMGAVQRNMGRSFELIKSSLGAARDHGYTNWKIAVEEAKILALEGYQSEALEKLDEAAREAQRKSLPWGIYYDEAFSGFRGNPAFRAYFE